MDPDSGSYFNCSMLLKASVLTVSFTAIYFYRHENRLVSFRASPAKKDILAAESVVKPATKPQRIHLHKKTIYLTFDDGPGRGSKNVMAILEEEQVPATLFIIGENIYGSRTQEALYDSAKQNDLFEIANHSYTHAFENHYDRFYDEPDSAVHDFERCADSLNLSTHIVRTPGRNIWRTENISSTDLKASTATGDSLYKKGFDAIGWDAEWHFDKDQRLVQTDSEMVSMIDSAFAHNRTRTKDNLVLLAHDRTFFKSDDSASLHRFISALKKKNEYDFETVSQYPGLTKDSSGTK
jgi:peptidoglycan/xylan/chitin deacetylase (PgdA/CDA1 family)